MFDLSNYMTAEERIELFAHHYPTFRMSSSHDIVSDTKTGNCFVVVKVALYKDTEDKFPWVIGMAAENLTTPFAFEKAETSAYARCITNCGDPIFSTTKDGKKAPRANREEMVKVAAIQNDKILESLPNKVKVEADLDWEEFLAAPPPKPKLGGGEEMMSDFADGVEVVKKVLNATTIPKCRHGEMEFKSGINKQGKPYSGFVCLKKGSEACPPVWNKTNG